MPSPTPDWFSRPAIGRLTIGKPRTLEPFETLNADKPYHEAIKPFNFMLAAHIPDFAAPPPEENPYRFQLIAPWERDPSQWAGLEWVNKYTTDGRTSALATGDSPTPAEAARVQSYADVLAEYRVHPEPKSLAPNGKPAGWHGDGLLERRSVTATRLVHVGKESNELEDKQAGVVHDPEEAINEHLAEDAWSSLVVPVLQDMPRSALRKHLSGTRISALRAGTLDPGRKGEISLTKVAGDFARERIREAGVTAPAGALDCCAAFLELKARDTATNLHESAGSP